MSKIDAVPFVLVSDVVQPLTTLSKTKRGRYFNHVATVRRGTKEYIAYTDPDDPKIWLEEVDAKEPSLLKKIKSDSEWQDLMNFLFDAKVLEIGNRKEVPLSMSAALALGFSNTKK